MNRFLVAACLILFGAISAFGQSTTVSGTITDTGGQTWNNGTYSFVFKVASSNPTAQYYWNGSPFSSTQTIQGNLDAAGSFTTSVPSNTSITPSGSTWTAQVCPAATATNGCSTLTLTITGVTQSLTSSLRPPPVQVNLAQPFAGAAAYTDGEIVGAKTGASYWNLSDSTFHACAGFPPCTWLSIGSGPASILPSNNVWTGTNTFNNVVNLNAGGSFGGTFSGNPTMTGNWTFSNPIAGSITNATNAKNLAGPGSVTGNYTHSGTESHAGSESFADINNVIVLDGVTNTTLNQALAKCTPGTFPSLCHIYVPPGTYTLSTQIKPNFGVIIEGAGSTYNNAGQNCATTINWTGGASAPFVLTGYQTQGSILEGFCLSATTGAAPPVYIDIDVASGDTVVRDLVIDTPPVQASIAAIRYGQTSNVVASNCEHVFVRSAAPIGFDILNAQAKWSGKWCRALQNGVNDWVIGGTSGQLVDNFTCWACAAEAASGNVGVLLNNAAQFSWNDGYSECGGSPTAYCFDIPSTAIQAQQITVSNSYAGGGATPGTTAFLHVALANATVSVTSNRIGDAIFANPSYIVQDDSVQRATIIGNTCSSTGCQVFKNGNNKVFSFGNTAVTLQPTVGWNIPIVTSFTTTAATTDNVTVTGMTSTGHCNLTPTNSGAAGGLAATYISAKTTNQITVTHTATSGWTFDVSCTSN